MTKQELIENLEKVKKQSEETIESLSCYCGGTAIGDSYEMGYKNALEYVLELLKIVE